MSDAQTLITNGKLITWGEPNRILDSYAILVDKGVISKVEPENKLISQYPDAKLLDARGQYVLPGNICAHTHFYGAFARGLAIPGKPPKDFPEILEKLWWPLDKSLTQEDVRASAQIMLVDAIRHGTTTLIDHHASPNFISGSLDVISEEVDASGLRAVLCYEVTDRDGKQKAKAGIDENVRFIKAAQNRKIADGRISATFGLHASLTLSESTLEACLSSIPSDSGFHIHVAEHEVDEYDSVEKAGLRVVDRLEKHGVLGPKTIVAHCVHVDALEISKLASSGTWVTHQPRSNMNNGVGAAPIESLLRAGVNVCLGTDGFPHRMWEEWKTAYLLQKVWHRDPRRLSGTDVAEISIYNNARLAQVFFPDAPIGVIEVGAHADLIFIEYYPHTPLNEDNLPWHIIFGFHESMITTTIVAGKVLMKDRKLLTLDEEAIASSAKKQSLGVWERYYKQF
ncbi:MAG: putative aminohydrolase SsnA [Anaerolineales bacterium]|nr:putative aminohydrolase SsnA [Anaerolineales bacterium]